jgi:hypothetical protein
MGPALTATVIDGQRGKKKTRRVNTTGSKGKANFKKKGVPNQA